MRRHPLLLPTSPSAWNDVVLTFALVLIVMLVLAASLYAPEARAQTVTDPTRPPAAAIVAAEPSEPRSAETRAADPAARAARAPAAAPQLQSIQIPQQGPASALVDGAMVRVGERVGAHTVVLIQAQSITLRNARGGTQILSLINGVSKTPSHPDIEITRTLAAGTRKTSP